MNQHPEPESYPPETGARPGLILGWILAWTGAVLLLRNIAAAEWAAIGGAGGGATPDDVFAFGAATAGLVICAWLASAALLTAIVTVLPASHLRQTLSGLNERITPALVRRGVVLALGAALVGTSTPLLAAGSAHAAASTSRSQEPAAHFAIGSTPAGSMTPAGPMPGASPTSTSSAAATGLDPGWTPTGAPAAADDAWDPGWRRATSAVSTASAGLPGTALRPGAHLETEVVVRRGDTLWDIAARHLGPAATDAEIATAWPGWFAANRVVIGRDPDRLTPGVRLRPPADPGTHATARASGQAGLP